MAVTLTGTGGLFTRLGKIIGAVNDIVTHQADIVTENTDIEGQYNANPELVSIISNSEVADQLQSGARIRLLAQLAQRTVYEMVNDDDPLPTGATLSKAIERLIEQMIDNSDSLDAVSSTGISSSADAGNTGTGKFWGSVEFPDDSSADNETIRAEDIELICIKDAQNDDVVAGREVFTIRGVPRISDIAHPDWPGGQGISSQLIVTDPSESPAARPGRNVLRNSEFEDFTSNAPDFWTLAAGIVAGTDVDDEGTTVYRGDKCLALIGDGSTTGDYLTQPFDNAGGTPVQLKPDTLYGLTFALQAESGTSGLIDIGVRDGTGTALDSGSSERTSIDVSSSIGSWTTNDGTTFRTPTVLPAGLEFYIAVDTAITNTKKVFIDNLVLFEMTQHGGVGGPFINLIAGPVDFKRDDKITSTIANNGDNLMQKGCDRLLGLHDLGLQFPVDSSGSETIADSLVS